MSRRKQANPKSIKGKFFFFCKIKITNNYENNVFSHFRRK
jgi:hypothetical protein